MHPTTYARLRDFKLGLRRIESALQPSGAAPPAASPTPARVRSIGSAAMSNAALERAMKERQAGERAGAGSRTEIVPPGPSPVAPASDARAKETAPAAPAAPAASRPVPAPHMPRQVQTTAADRSPMVMHGGTPGGERQTRDGDGATSEELKQRIRNLDERTAGMEWRHQQASDSLSRVIADVSELRGLLQAMQRRIDELEAARGDRPAPPASAYSSLSIPATSADFAANFARFAEQDASATTSSFAAASPLVPSAPLGAPSSGSAAHHWSVSADPTDLPSVPLTSVGHAQLVASLFGASIPTSSTQDAAPHVGSPPTETAETAKQAELPAALPEASEAQLVDLHEASEAQPVELPEASEAQPVELPEASEAQPVELTAEVDAQPVELIQSDDAQPVELTAEVDAQPVELIQADDAQPVELIQADDAQPVELIQSDDAQPVELPATTDAQPEAEPTWETTAAVLVMASEQASKSPSLSASPEGSPSMVLPKEVANRLGIEDKVCSADDLRAHVLRFGRMNLNKSSVPFLRALCMCADRSYVSPKTKTVDVILEWAAQRDSAPQGVEGSVGSPPSEAKEAVASGELVIDEAPEVEGDA
jgi:hypothetical protein